VPVFGHQQNKQTAELEREPSCSIVSQLAVIIAPSLLPQKIRVDLYLPTLATTFSFYYSFPQRSRHQYFRVLLFLLVEAEKSRKKRPKSMKKWKSYKFKKPGSVPSKANIFECSKSRLVFF